MDFTNRIISIQLNSLSDNCTYASLVGAFLETPPLAEFISPCTSIKFKHRRTVLIFSIYPEADSNIIMFVVLDLF